MRSLMSRSTNPTGSEDGPEEGEIVSDDFEDISDESIIFTPSNGKSLSRSDHLHALSLSSVTDIDEPPVQNRIKRRKSYSEKHTRRRKRSRRKQVETDSSEEETTLDRKLKLQLKAAIQVDVEEAHKNSLRTRLRAMVQSNSGPESDAGTTKQILTCSENEVKVPEQDLSVIVIESGSESVSAPEIVYKASEDAPSSTETILSAPEQNESDSVPIKDEVDTELIHLRIEALKTALNNKFANRKRRKKDNSNVQTSDDTNKENTNHTNDKDKVKKTDLNVEIPQTSPQLGSETPQSPEEDEDVLRALLLASMSKKITSVEPELTKTSVQQTQAKPVTRVVTGTNYKVTTSGRSNILNNFKINYVKKVISSKKNVVNKAMGNTKLVKIPQVKPLIINVNSDSDSDLDISSSPEKQPEKAIVISEKESHVRSAENKVENRVVENAIESSVDKFLKEQRAKVESEVLTSNKTMVNTALSIDDTKKIINTNVVQNNTKIASNYNKTTLSTLLAKTKGKNSNILNKTSNTTKSFKFTDLERSALKFLPEDKREEYKQLQNLLRLKKAELKKPRVRKISQRVDNNLKITLITKSESAEKNSKVANENTPNTENKFSEIASEIASGEKANTDCNSKIVLPLNKSLKLSVVPKLLKNNIKPVNKDTISKIVLKKENTGQFLNIHETSHLVRGDAHKQRKSDALLLHNTLKQMQIRKNGRLQIQERYKGLLPLVKKINQVSKEQKSWDQHVKRLLEQLAEARKQQQEVHEKMSSLVTDLSVNKERTDLSLAKVSIKPKINKNVITSTPMKPSTSNMSIDLSAVKNAESLMSTSQSTTEQESINTTDSILSGAKSGDEKSSHMLNTWEQSTKLDINVSKQKDGETRPVGDPELNIVVDPNDIDNIIKRTEAKVAVLEQKESCEGRTERVRYVSPLDSVKRKESFDPFAIMCPFEVNGTCKDTECTFKHLPK